MDANHHAQLGFYAAWLGNLYVVPGETEPAEQPSRAAHNVRSAGSARESDEEPEPAVAQSAATQATAAQVATALPDAEAQPLSEEASGEPPTDATPEEPPVDAATPTEGPQPPPTAPDDAPGSRSRRRVEGGKRRPILILVNELSDDDRSLLTNILRALALSWDDVAVANADNQPVVWRPLVEKLGTEQLICFGMKTLLDPRLPGSPYQLIDSGKLQLVFADPLATVGRDAARKKMLWRELKLMFPS